jgi:hypothetical protein
MKLLLALSCVVASSALATSAVALSLEDLTRESNAIYVGTVRSVEARWTRDQRRIITDTTIEISEVLKGRAQTTAVIMQPGGALGEIGQKVIGVAEFQVGEEVVVFLESRGENFTVSGLAQGKLTVERSSDGRSVFAIPTQAGLELMGPQPALGVMPLETLRERVRFAVDSVPDSQTFPAIHEGPAAKKQTLPLGITEGVSPKPARNPMVEKVPSRESKAP